MINLTFSGDAGAVLAEMRAFLGATAVEAAVAELPAVVAETGAISSGGSTASEMLAQEEKPKKSRAKKADAAPAEAAKEPETAAEATTYVATEQDARDALRRLHEATNEDTCMQALNSFNNARRISEVPDDQRTAFVLLCNEKIAAAAGKVA